MKKLKFKKKINIIESKNINFYQFNKGSINFIDVKVKLNNNIQKISKNLTYLLKNLLK